MPAIKVIPVRMTEDIRLDLDDQIMRLRRASGRRQVSRALLLQVMTRAVQNMPTEVLVAYMREILTEATETPPDDPDTN